MLSDDSDAIPMHFDAEGIIEAVKKRPALYDKHYPGYINTKENRIGLWKGVCEELIPTYRTSSAQERMEYVREVQKRWRNLRTCFTRELSLQKLDHRLSLKNKPRMKRKKYAYFDLMSFLLDEMNIEIEIPKDNPNPKTEPKSDEETGDDPLNAQYAYEVNKNEDSHQEEEIVPEPVPQYKVRRTTAYKRARNEASKKSPESAVDDTGDRLMGMLKEIMRAESDGDRQFMLSLVPSFKKLSDKQKFEARIRILKVLRDITFDESGSC